MKRVKLVTDDVAIDLAVSVEGAVSTYRIHSPPLHFEGALANHLSSPPHPSPTPDDGEDDNPWVSSRLLALRGTATVSHRMKTRDRELLRR